VRRRDLLRLAAASAAALALPRGARALGKKSLFRFGQLQLGSRWNVRPTALRRMAWEIDKRTAISVDLESRPLAIADPALFELPFLVLTGDREFALPAEPEVERLRRYLTFGGFLLIDSAEGATGGAFDAAVRQLVEAIYPAPSRGLALVPKDHVVYKSFYLVDRPVGRLALAPAMEAVTRDDRLTVAYVANDLGGAWSRDDFGNWEFQCTPDGERQREMAFRFGVNLAMYALCLDYKADQVHVEHIMRRRRWRPSDDASPAAPDGGKAR
jgi:hypothetical protein